MHTYIYIYIYIFVDMRVSDCECVCVYKYVDIVYTKRQIYPHISFFRGAGGYRLRDSHDHFYFFSFLTDYRTSRFAHTRVCQNWAALEGVCVCVMSVCLCVYVCICL